MLTENEVKLALVSLTTKQMQAARRRTIAAEAAYKSVTELDKIYKESGSGSSDDKLISDSLEAMEAAQKDDEDWMQINEYLFKVLFYRKG